MLLTLKGNTTTGSFLLCHLLNMLCIMNLTICISIGLYTIMICTNGVIVDMYLCVILASRVPGPWILLNECLLYCELHLFCVHADTA